MGSHRTPQHYLTASRIFVYRANSNTVSWLGWNRHWDDRQWRLSDWRRVDAVLPYFTYFIMQQQHYVSSKILPRSYPYTFKMNIVTIWAHYIRSYIQSARDTCRNVVYIIYIRCRVTKAARTCIALSMILTKHMLCFSCNFRVFWKKDEAKRRRRKAQFQAAIVNHLRFENYWINLLT